MGEELPHQTDLPLGGGQDTVLDRLRSWRKKPNLTRDQALLARPIRNPALKWRAAEDGEVTVTLPRRQDWIGKLLAIFFYVPESRDLRLDVVGARVWELCDGERTVSALVDALAQEHRLHRKEAEVSLTTFLRDLGKRGMIAFAVPREFVESPDAKPGPKAPARDAAAERPVRRKKGRRRR